MEYKKLKPVHSPLIGRKRSPQKLSTHHTFLNQHYWLQIVGLWSLCRFCRLEPYYLRNVCLGGQYFLAQINHIPWNTGPSTWCGVETFLFDDE